MCTPTSSPHRAKGAELYGRLAEELAGWARTAGAKRLLGELADSEPARLEQLSDHGWRVDAHIRTATAELTGSSHPRPPAIEGIAFTTVTTSTVPNPLEQLYDLYRETLRDNPGFIDELPGFDAWRAETLEGPHSKPEWVFTAEHRGQIVGVTAVEATDDPHNAYVDYTGVVKAWRGRGLARALKVGAAAQLAASGIRRLETEVDASNTPMLAVNTSLGYLLGPGHYRMVTTF